VPRPRSAGLTWAEGKLWVAHYRNRKIHQVDPSTGKVLRTLSSTRFVTGVTFVDDELWHGTWEDDRSELRHISPESGGVLDTLEMPDGTFVSGLESNGKDLFYCGGGPSGTVASVVLLEPVDPTGASSTSISPTFSSVENPKRVGAASVEAT
jgi:DNA-binding beta-propeller fold protein YncE